MLRRSELTTLAGLLLAPALAAQGTLPNCPAGESENGCAPAISANVQPNTTNDAGCRITVGGLDGQRSGLLFYGVDNSGWSPVPWGPGSSSWRCVKAPTVRLGAPTSSGGTAGACDGTFLVDWDAFQAANPTALGNPWVAGDKVFAQAWYRDPLAPQGSNLSNALVLTVRNPEPVPCQSPLAGLVRIPAGTFSMGSSAAWGSPYFGPIGVVHQVTISSCFWMGETEVTQAEYAALMGTNPAQFTGANRPVERVSWHQARAYCELKTAQQAALGNVPQGYEYRLPTEAEWEYACRAGTTTEFNIGPSLLCGDARMLYSYHTNSSCPGTATVDVRSFAPNAWGLFDMHGNVLEWCLDSYSPYVAGAVTDPLVTGGSQRVFRGGAWNLHSSYCRSASRFSDDPADQLNVLGFRVVLAPILDP